MKLNANRSQLELHITGSHSAADIEALMRQLALLRAEMQPAVPDKPDPDMDVLIEDKAPLLLSVREGGGIRLWLRHRGFGWTAWQIDDNTAVAMARYIARRCVAADAQPIEFIGDHIAHRH